MRTRENATDLFAQLWGALALEPSLTLEAIAAQVADRPVAELHVQSWVQNHLVSRSPLIALTELRKFISEDKFGYGALGTVSRQLLVAQAIDQWFQGVGARALGARVHHELVRAQYLLTSNGRFNSDLRFGQVIPRLPGWGRWVEPDLIEPFQAGEENTRILYEIFHSLAVMPPSIAASNPDNCNDLSDSRKVKLNYRIFNPGDSRDPDDRSIEDLVVGFAPICQDLDDIGLPIHSIDGDHWYDAMPTKQADRIVEAVKALCEAGAHIIMFPEATIHPEAHEALIGAIERHGKKSQLRLVVAGTTPRDTSDGMPYNEATLYNWLGQELGRQRKLHRWNLDVDQRRPFGFAPDMPSERKLFERIKPGEEVHVFEMGGLGRFTVMICEDLSRTEPGLFLRNNLLLDWVFTPILDKSIEPYRWMKEKGEGAALGGRCRVAVCNSLSLTHLVNKIGVSSPMHDCGAALCIDRVPPSDYSPMEPATIRYLVWRPGLNEVAPHKAVRWDDEW